METPKDYGSFNLGAHEKAEDAFKAISSGTIYKSSEAELMEHLRLLALFHSIPAAADQMAATMLVNALLSSKTAARVEGQTKEIIALTKSVEKLTKILLYLTAIAVLIGVLQAGIMCLEIKRDQNKEQSHEKNP